MAGKIDGVIEAVHYDSHGRVEYVRLYERRGATFSDHVLVKRDDLVARLKKGKKYVTGQRRSYLASTFHLGTPVQLREGRGGEVLTTSFSDSWRDDLQEVPIL